VSLARDDDGQRLVQGLSLDPSGMRACCAELYASDWIELLLGDSLHPGELVLTDRLASLAGIRRRSRVLDVASGRGATAIHLAEHYGCQIVGVDFGANSVELAWEVARRVGVEEQVRFSQGDAERLDFPDDSFDVVICECAFCTFPDKPAAAREIARVLRPGGRAALSDLTRSGPLPQELRNLISWLACIADALPLEDYAEHLTKAGLVIQHVERHDAALHQLVRDVRTRLLAADVLAKLKRIDLPGVDLRGATEMARSAAAAVESGVLGYGIFVGMKGAG
jgi:arsenite methyltransferase